VSEKREFSSGVAKFLGVTVAAALVTTAVTNVYENRNATSEARQAMVRELTETVASVSTARSIAASGNAPAAYLNRRCVDLKERLPDSAALKDACDKAVVDELFQEQELGNQERRDLARLGVLAEVAEGQFGAKPADSIRELQTATRGLGRLTNANQPPARQDIVDELNAQPHIKIPDADAHVLVTSVTPDGDVIATKDFVEAFERTSDQVDKLTKNATAEIRSAHVEGRDTSFMAAAWKAIWDPFILLAFALALVFYARATLQPSSRRSGA